MLEIKYRWGHMSSRRPRVVAYLFIFSFKKKLFVLHFLLDNDCAAVPM